MARLDVEWLGVTSLLPNSGRPLWAKSAEILCAGFEQAFDVEFDKKLAGRAHWY